MDFFGLPASLSCRVLSSFVDLKSFVRLDTAVSGSNERSTQLRDVVDSSELILQFGVNVSDADALLWLTRRRVKVENIELDGDMDECCFRKYLREFGQFLRKVTLVDSCSSESIVLMAVYCKKLTTFRHYGEELAAVCDVLISNPNIAELRFENILDEEVQDLSSITCPQLERLSITQCPELTSFPWCNYVGPNLRCLHLAGLTWMTRDDVITIGNACSALKTLALRFIPLNDSVLAHFATLCPTIKELDLVGNEVVTDASILSIVRNLPQLNVLALYKCTSLTSLALTHINAHCKDRLVEIHIDVDNAIIDAFKTLLLNANPSALGLFLSNELNHSQLDSLLAATARVKILNLSAEEREDDILCLVGKHCHNVEKLSISNDEVRPFILDAAPCALAYGCPRLTVLTMDDANAVPSAVRRFWNKVRPQMRFELLSDSPPYNWCS